jgi:Ran GTPase-activating protein (RanGAP) involved in mRNA processing and transport
MVQAMNSGPAERKQSSQRKLSPETMAPPGARPSAPGKSGQPGQDEGDEGYFPFVQSSEVLNPESVVGVIFKPGKKVELSNEKTYYVTQLNNEEFNFSDQNSFKKHPKLISAEFNGLSLSRDSLENIIKYIPDALKSLLVHSCVIKESYYELLADLVKRRPDLITFSIVDTEASAESLIKLLTALQNCKKLQFLRIVIGEISKDVLEIVASILEECSATLKEFSFGCISHDGDSETSQKLMEAIGKASKLTKLEFSILSATDAELESFSSAVGELQKLRALQLFIGGIAEHDHIKLFEAAETFQKSLEKQRDLESLDISSMNLPGDIMQLWMQALQQEIHKLKTLNISGNTLDEKSAEFLSSTLSSNRELSIFIANDCGIDDKVLNATFKNLKNSGLEQIYLSRNHIEKSAASIPFSELPNLLLIDLSHNKMQYEDAFALIQKTPDSQKLSLVNLEGLENGAMDTVALKIWFDDLETWKYQYLPNRQIVYLGLGG